MVKIGRNAPCPCGSGKKYKKCCLDKDQESSRAKAAAEQSFPDSYKELELEKAGRGQEIEEEDQALFEDEDFADLEEDDDEGEDDIEWDYILEDEAVEDQARKKISDKIPAISHAQEVLVDKWWEDYKRMQDVDQIKRHLEAFLDEHPSLVVNLELHHDALFELGAAFNRQNRPAEYIDLLIRMRKDFPDSYIKSFGYYDRDIISHKISTGQKDEIEDYLSYFREYPDHDPDNLFKVLRMLMAANCQEIVSRFVRDIYYEVCTSPNIFGGEEILDPLVLSYFIPFLRADYSADDMEELAWQLQKIKIPLNEDYYRPDYLQEEFSSIFGNYSGWTIKDCKTRKDMFRRYHTVGLNFMRFLKEEKGKDWMAAELHRKMLLTYLANVIPTNKKPKEAFIFTKDKIEHTIASTCKSFLFLDSIKTFVSLSAIYWFAEYLAGTQTITQDRKDLIQQWCSELYETVYPGLVAQEIEALAFAAFPS